MGEFVVDVSRRAVPGGGGQPDTLLASVQRSGSRKASHSSWSTDCSNCYEPDPYFLTEQRVLLEKIALLSSLFPEWNTYRHHFHKLESARHRAHLSGYTATLSRIQVACRDINRADSEDTESLVKRIQQDVLPILSQLDRTMLQRCDGPLDSEYTLQGAAPKLSFAEVCRIVESLRTTIPVDSSFKHRPFSHKKHGKRSSRADAHGYGDSGDRARYGDRSRRRYLVEAVATTDPIDGQSKPTKTRVTITVYRADESRGTTARDEVPLPNEIEQVAHNIEAVPEESENDERKTENEEKELGEQGADAVERTSSFLAGRGFETELRAGGFEETGLRGASLFEAFRSTPETEAKDKVAKKNKPPKDEWDEFSGVEEAIGFPPVEEGKDILAAEEGEYFYSADPFEAGRPLEGPEDIIRGSPSNSRLPSISEDSEWSKADSVEGKLSGATPTKGTAESESKAFQGRLGDAFANLVANKDDDSIHKPADAALISRLPSRTLGGDIPVQSADEAGKVPVTLESISRLPSRVLDLERPPPECPEAAPLGDCVPQDDIQEQLYGPEGERLVNYTQQQSMARLASRVLVEGDDGENDGVEGVSGAARCNTLQPVDSYMEPENDAIHGVVHKGSPPPAEDVKEISSCSPWALEGGMAFDGQQLPVKT